MPYARERTIERGIINDTFETAITWERFDIRRQGQTRDGARNFASDWANRPGDLPLHPCVSGRAGAIFYVQCRWAAWRVDPGVHTIESAALDAVTGNGGTVTHHHAVGRDHRPWYDRQRPPLFAAALKAAKATLDPLGLLNPGVLIDP